MRDNWSSGLFCQTLKSFFGANKTSCNFLHKLCSLLQAVNRDKPVNFPFATFTKLTFLAPHLLQLPITDLCDGTSPRGGLASQQVISPCMRNYDLQTHACETGGQSDPGEEPWLILHQAQIEASFWGDLPSGIGLSPASVQPQLLDGTIVWLPAKRNVYTNTHNCSERSHGELTIPSRGALVHCCDFSETGAPCSSGKHGGGVGGGGVAVRVLNWPSGSTFVWN